MQTKRWALCSLFCVLVGNATRRTSTPSFDFALKRFQLEFSFRSGEADNLLPSNRSSTI